MVFEEASAVEDMDLVMEEEEEEEEEEGARALDEEFDEEEAEEEIAIEDVERGMFEDLAAGTVDGG